jgi:hypothetical protein
VDMADESSDEARAERAKQLREQIEQIKKGQPGGQTPGQNTSLKEQIEDRETERVVPQNPNKDR